MHAHYTATMLKLLSDNGVSEAQLRLRAGIDSDQPLDTSHTSQRQYDAICLSALELSGDPQFGLRLGSKIDLPSQGIFGFALMSCATAGDALKLLLRYNRVVLPSIRIAFREDDSGSELFMQAAHLTPSLERFYCEVLFAAVLNSGVILDGENSGSVIVELDYEPAENHQLYTQILGPLVHFNSGRRALCFDQHSLTARISTANPISSDIFRRECDRLFSPDGQRGTISERVQQLLIQCGAEFPSCEKVAVLLHMSESTLRRRLAAEGLRYQTVLDEVRYRLAREYLSGTELPVVHIAELLGFSDATNFRRSFRRWSGTTPSQLRMTNGNSTQRASA